MRPPKLNSIEPPRYGSVCQVVWEGRCREASPYPDQSPYESASRAFGIIGDEHATGISMKPDLDSRRVVGHEKQAQDAG